MKANMFDSILSFLHGIAWAFIVIGAFITFKIFAFLGLATALFFTIFFIILGLFGILILEALSIHKERLKEAKKQTALLEEIYSKTVEDRQ